MRSDKIVLRNGNIEYRNEDSHLHREDGPAVEWVNGSKIWYKDGKKHREDGPAVEWADDTKEWYINGENLTEEEFNVKVNNMENTELKIIKNRFKTAVMGGVKSGKNTMLYGLVTHYKSDETVFIATDTDPLQLRKHLPGDVDIAIPKTTKFNDVVRSVSQLLNEGKKNIFIEDMSGYPVNSDIDCIEILEDIIKVHDGVLIYSKLQNYNKC